MVHRHVHKRHDDHQHRDDPFSSIISDISAGVSSIKSIFGDGGPASTAAASSSPSENPTSPGPAPGPAPGPVSNPAPVAPPDPKTSTKVGGDSKTTVYVTAPWTGSGTIYSLSTVSTTQEPHATQSISTPVTSDSESESVQPTTSQTQPTTFHKSHKVSSPQSSSISAAAAAATTSNSAFTTAAAATTSFSSILSASLSSTSASQAAATSNSAALGVSQNSGLSGGAKAGIAIGVILGVLALVAGAFALYRMKKNRDEAAFDGSEKNPFSDTAAVNMVPVRAASPPTVPTGSSNPFGSGAVPMGSTTTSNGFNSGAIAAAGGLAGAALGATAANMTRTKAPPPLNVNRAQSPALVPPPPVVPSPVGSTFSESSTLTNGAMAAMGGAGAGSPAGPRMHRVQMDFNPTMEDELRIVAGEIVRIVRNFDDGWCSVEIVQRDGQGNIMRHQQGVVPRTCLSRLPLKPRQRRPGPPGTGPAAPMNMGPQNPGRMQSPAFASNPTGRSMSPGPYGGGPQDRPQRPDTRSRSNSANDINPRARVAGPGPSRMNPAVQNPRPVELPMSQSMTALATPAYPSHNRNESGASTASAPVARKPVPGQFDA